MKIGIVLGTRPEIIKFSPIIRENERMQLDYFVIHTGQHYSYNMDRVFFRQLGLPEPKFVLQGHWIRHGKQTGRMLEGIEKILIEKEHPSVVLVEGDTNTVLAGALAATKLGIKVGHVEAGLRSYDEQMPEEVNRVLADHCSNFLFAPTSNSKKILLKEGIRKNRIFVTGNTIVDAVFQNLDLSNKTNILKKLDIKQHSYFIATIHRQENVDNADRFKKILRGLELVQQRFGFPVIYPVHPRARKQLETLRLRPNGVQMIRPMDYLSFLQLESKAKLVLTDSGGVQEEACILKIPCVTLRNNTERPETLEIGANILAGVDPETIVEKTMIMLGRENRWQNPFGDGKAGKQIIRILTRESAD